MLSIQFKYYIVDKCKLSLNNSRLHCAIKSETVHNKNNNNDNSNCGFICQVISSTENQQQQAKQDCLKI